MTLARKGSRRIIVDGVEFRWVVRRKPTYNQGNAWSPLIFVVERAKGPGAILVVSLPYARPDNWLGRPSGPVHPVMVASSVRLALAGGWQPARPGPAFTLKLAEVAGSER
jgi:hypothetical protein